MASKLAVLSSGVLFPRFGDATIRKWKSSSFVCLAWRRETEVNIDVGLEEKPFVYRRASAAERWPNSNDESQQRAVREDQQVDDVRVGFRVRVSDEGDGHTSPIYRLMREDKARDKAREREMFHQRQTGQVRKLKRMAKLALKRARDWKSRTERLANAICELELARPVADVLEDWPEQLNNEDLSVVLGNVGRENWRRALELYECLNLRKWYTPNPRMLATILGILGRSNQVYIARELFVRAEPELTGDHIQVRLFTV